MSSDFDNEQQLHLLIEKAIREDELGSIIDSNIFEAEKDSTVVIPRFSIDYITRKKLLKAGLNVLSSLNSLHILTSDNNISVTKNEVLRPDIVAICSENDSIIIFEFKKSKQAERQTLTELLAYEQEIKNIMPMLTNYDVKFVVVTTEWSPLLQHSVASKVTWSNRQILCLTASLNTEKQLSLKTFIPTAWKNTGNVYIPERALSCLTLCLYEKNNGQNIEDDKDTQGHGFDDRILTAIENMVHTGNLINAHGFILLWKDSYYDKLSLTKYNITVCGISAYELFNISLLTTDKGAKHWLVNAVSKYISDFSPSGHSESLFHIANSSNSLLDTFVDPRTEGYNHWETEKRELSYRGEVLFCNFFGLIGEYARDHVLNPKVKKSNVNQFLNSVADWRYPLNGLRLIKNLSQPEFFSTGKILCSDAFKLGRLIGIDSFLRLNLQKNSDSILANKFQWNLVSLLEAFDEVTLITGTSKNISKPSPLKFSLNHENIFDYSNHIEWLLKSFFKESPEHSLLFYIGLNGNILFDDLSHKFFHKDNLNEIWESIEEDIVLIINTVLGLYKQLEIEDGLYDNLEETYKYLKHLLDSDEKDDPFIDSIEFSSFQNVWSKVLESVDRLTLPAFHAQDRLNVSEYDIDWEWLRQGINEMLERGENDAGFILSANGETATGRVFERLGIKSPDSPLEDGSLYFYDESSGLGVIKIVTWDELMSGDAY